MSDLKMTCPACQSWTTAIGEAFREGGPCPVCGVSALAAFILARVAEDEARARRFWEEWSTKGGVIDVSRYVGPTQTLAECEAKRQIVALHDECGTGYGYCDDGGHGWDGIVGCADLALAALPYRDHPDFDPAWLP